MAEDAPDKDDLMINAAKKSSKQILEGLGKASMLFTKRMAEGAFNAQLAQAKEEDTSKKIKVAGAELGKAILRGAVEGGSVGMTTLIEGVNTFSKEMNKHAPKKDPSEDYTVEDLPEGGEDE